MKKGLSPLIAAVILIAATMSIAGILSFWASGFVRKKLAESQNVSEQSTCLGAQLKLRLSKYDNTTHTLYLVVDNLSRVDLTLENLYLLYPERMETKPLHVTLKGEEMKQLTIDNVTPGFENAIIKTNCPNVDLSIIP